MIDLYTAATPNGWKISIMLEELDVEYQVIPVRLDKNEQKDPDFLRINSNGRIPAIVDHDDGGFPVFESGAILIYLAEKFGRFLPSEDQARSRALQWLMFQMGGIGPMMGQAYHFYEIAGTKIEYAIKRYQDETARLFGVLDGHLKDNDHLADEYSIADIATYPWIMGHEKVGVDAGPFSHLQRWMTRVGERPAVQRGLEIPPQDKSEE